MAGPPMRERLVRLQDELEHLGAAAAAAAAVDGVAPTGCGSGGAAADAAAVEELRQELKHKKFVHLSVQAQLSFVSGCLQGDLSPDLAAQGQKLEAARREAKERNQALKREEARETEEHARLCIQRMEAYREAMRGYEECQEVMRQLQSLVEEEEAEEVGLPGEGLEALTGSLGCSADEEEGEAPERALLEQPEELAKRRRLEYERRYLERQRRVPEELRAELVQLEARERREVERLEALERLQCEHGLPKLHVDDSGGTVMLGGPRAAGELSEDFAVRTVKVERDASGHLVRAETHPSLGLWNEATHCVNDNDLARLLTLVWDRLCEQQCRNGTEPAELGGA
mmetsp:Transcript_129453/g.360580  ORF Transcript_129453/g.360580 Transcript_129453/m.360580 type:complete len:343 (-) Transcript_129453:115-1143(-)